MVGGRSLAAVAMISLVWLVPNEVPPGSPRAHVPASLVYDGARLRVGDASLRFGVEAIGRGEALSALPPTDAQRDEGRHVREHALADGTTASEWLVAGSSEGRATLEHGVTLARRPSGEGALTLDVMLEGAIAHDAGSDAVVFEGAAAPVRYAGLLVLDASGARVPATLRAHDGRARITVDDAGALYPIVVDPFVLVEEAYFIATSPLCGASACPGGANLGASVSIDAAGARLIVGVPGGDGSDAGTFRILERTGTSWANVSVELGTAAIDNGDELGSFVAISGDGNAAMVGTRPGEAGGQAGEMWRLERSAGGSWSVTEEIAPTIGGARGLAAGIVLNGAGDIAIVSRFEGSYIEQVDEWQYAVGGTFEPAAWRPVREVTSDEGHVVAISRDGAYVMVGDETATVSSEPQAGAARVFVRSGATWAEQASLSPPVVADQTHAGVALAISADGTTAVVGAAGGTPPIGPRIEPHADVYVRSGTTWSHQAVLAPTVRMSELTVSVSDDGSRAVLAGQVTSTPRAAVARVFLRSGSVWREEGAITRTASTLADPTVAVGAISGDGARLLVGLPDADRVVSPSAPSVGALTVLRLDLSTLGSACTSDGTCESGFCVDGVCCDGACGDGATDDCQACSVARGAATDGACGAMTASAPPVICRTSAGACDPAEACAVGDAACPADALAPTTQVCRAAVGPCDAIESCDGVAIDCPADALEPTSTVCRASADDCDVEDRCDGASIACPPDRIAGNDVICRPAAGPCDIADACNGVVINCPADIVSADGAACRPDDCGRSASCDGESVTCPVIGPETSGTICRPADGLCDVADRCNGTDLGCPDEVVPAGMACGDRTSVGPCDTSDVCNGERHDCPDVFLEGVDCRPSTGGCDPAEVCSGSAATCPPDALALSGTVCRAATASCDSPESCDGASASCPADETTCAPTDAPGPVDGGGTDAGTVPVPASCACRTGARGSDPTWLAIIAALLMWRRKRG